jgi:4-hydroxy-tetrahydrodipicolinate synthase
MAANIGTGLVPVMLTPFLGSGEVDFAGLDGLTDWYIASGAKGLFTVAQSSEMFKLTPEERVGVASRVVARAAGRVPVVASGTFPPLGAGGAGLEEQAASVKAMAATGVSAVVVLASCMATEAENEEQFRANLTKLLELTPGIQLAQYEVPAPYHRKCSPETLAWIAKTGRFSFHKDTSRHTPLISAKLAAIKSAGLDASNPFRFFNGNVTGLLFSLREGGSGGSVVCANFYPHLVAWLCDNHDKAEKAKVEKVQRFLTNADALIKVNYPASAKVYLKTQCGVDIGPGVREGKPFPDASGPEGEELMLRLEALHAWAAETAAECGATVAAAPVITR